MSARGIARVRRLQRCQNGLPAKTRKRGRGGGGGREVGRGGGDNRNMASEGKREVDREGEGEGCFVGGFRVLLKMG